jgi:hypothetical protein
LIKNYLITKRQEYFLEGGFLSFFLSFLFLFLFFFFFFLKKETPSNLYFQHLTFLKHYFIAIYTSKLSTRFTGLNLALENIHIMMDKILDDIIKEKMQTSTTTKDDGIVWCASSTSGERAGLTLISPETTSKLKLLG